MIFDIPPQQFDEKRPWSPWADLSQDTVSLSAVISDALVENAERILFVPTVQLRWAYCDPRHQPLVPVLHPRAARGHDLRPDLGPGPLHHRRPLRIHPRPPEHRRCPGRPGRPRLQPGRHPGPPGRPHHAHGPHQAPADDPEARRSAHDGRAHPLHRDHRSDLGPAPGRPGLQLQDRAHRGPALPERHVALRNPHDPPGPRGPGLHHTAPGRPPDSLRPLGPGRGDPPDPAALRPGPGPRPQRGPHVPPRRPGTGGAGQRPLRLRRRRRGRRSASPPPPPPRLGLARAGLPGPGPLRRAAALLPPAELPAPGRRDRDRRPGLADVARLVHRRRLHRPADRPDVPV